MEYFYINASVLLEDLSTSSSTAADIHHVYTLQYSDLLPIIFSNLHFLKAVRTHVELSDK